MEYKPVTLARCGMDCTQCRFASENDCPGCMQGQLFDDEQCDIYDCCGARMCEHCGKCKDFPCDDLKSVSYDVETGDGGARLIRLKSLRDEENRKKESRIKAFLGGACLGISIGAVIGAVTGAFAAWIAAGAVVGCGTGFILHLSSLKK